MKKFLSLSLGLLIVSLVAGCTTTQTTTNTTDAPLSVVASFYPMYYFASEIGGNSATVSNLTPVGTEPHDYELTPQDIVRIQDSQLLVLNGAQLEPWANDVMADLSDDVTVVQGSGGLADHTIEEDHVALVDPHVWLSPKLAQTEVETITDSFISADPIDAIKYIKNSEALIERLDELDDEYKAGLADCDSDTIITAHAAFSYLADTYDLKQLSIAGLSPETDPSLSELTDIIDFAEDHDVQYIFFESLASPKLAKAIADEIGAKTLVLNPLEGLTYEDIDSGQDYFTVMKANLANLRTALGCQ